MAETVSVSAGVKVAPSVLAEVPFVSLGELQQLTRGWVSWWGCRAVGSNLVMKPKCCGFSLPRGWEAIANMILVASAGWLRFDLVWACLMWGIYGVM